ncbi:MAG: HAMP domain-containing histidine kinase, partial [Sphingobacteriaceae bacterium]
MLHKVKVLAEKLIGVSVSADLESRIFNAVSFFIGIVLILNSLANYLLNLPVLTILMFTAASIALFLYYLSRIKRKLGVAVLLFGLLGNAVLAVNFFYNSGLQGPTLLVFTLLVFLLMAISPKKQHLFWMILHPVNVSVLLIVDYYYPDHIENSYATRFSLYADYGYSYLVVTVLIGLIMTYFKTSYNQQKILLENRASQLVDVNQTKDKLFSIIAHDLRSPMASIQNYLEILNEYKFTSEEKKTMELELLSKTKNTDQLLSNLLYWSMNQINGVKVNLVSLNLKETLISVLQLAQVAATDKGIDIDNLLPPKVVLQA